MENDMLSSLLSDPEALQNAMKTVSDLLGGQPSAQTEPQNAYDPASEMMQKALPVIGAIAQSDIKRLLSFTLVSHIGYMLMGIGTGLTVGIAGGVLHMFNHVLYKTGLFMAAGAVAMLILALSGVMLVARRAALFCPCWMLVAKSCW